MPGRRVLQALAGVAVAAITLAVTPTSAMADKVIPVGASGSACSENEKITTNTAVYWQTCAWVSGGASPRVWFTVHLGNNSGRDVRIDKVDVNYQINDVTRDCGV